MIKLDSQTLSSAEIKTALASTEEISKGTIAALSIEGKTLGLVLEVNAELLEDTTVFTDYILPSIDEKVKDILADKFKLRDSKRFYLKQGSAEQIFGGTPESDWNLANLDTDNTSIVLAIRPKDAGANTTGLTAEILDLFKKIVGQVPALDEPFLDLGGDSIKVLEFLEKLQETHPLEGKELLDMIEEATTLKEIISWFDE